MPSTPTDQLRLEQQGLGENVNTWGDDRLNRVLRAIAQAIAGRVSLDISGASGGAYTVASSNYAVDDARSMVLEFTGSLTGDVHVAIPDEEKLYVLYNACTLNGYVVTVGTSAGQTVMVPNEGALFVVCDGTDTVAARTLDMGNERVRGLATPVDANDAATKQYVDDRAFSGDTVPGQSGQANKHVTTNGTSAYWAPAPSMALTTNDAVTAGRAVVTRSDGQVEVVKGASFTTVLNSFFGYGGFFIEDTVNNRQVFIGGDGSNSSYLTAWVFQVNSDGTFNVGSPVVIDTNRFNDAAAAFDPDTGRILVVNRNASTGDMNTYVCRVSNMTMTVGTPQTHGSMSTSHFSATYDASSQKCVIAHRGNGSSNTSDAAVSLGYIDTSTETFVHEGFTVVDAGSYNEHTSATFDPIENVVLIGWQRRHSDYDYYVAAGQVSGTSISFGTLVEVFPERASQPGQFTYDPDQAAFLVALSSVLGGVHLNGVCLSGTTVTVGTPTEIAVDRSGIIGSAFIPPDDTHVVIDDHVSTDEWRAWRVTLSGTTVSAGPQIDLGLSTDLYPYSLTWDASTDKLVQAGSNSSASVAGFIQLDNDWPSLVTNTGEWIGVAQSSAVAGDAVQIALKGALDTNQSGLTPGARYYLADDGNPTTTDNGRYFGRALSATSILLASTE